MTDEQKKQSADAPVPISRSDRVARRLDAIDLTVRPMTADDRGALLGLADGLPDHDLLFLRRDIRDEAVVDQWIGEIDSGQIVTLLAFADDQLIGYASIDRSQLHWSAHVAEIRVVVSEAARGKGLGRLLVEQAFQAAVAAGIEKIVARMTLDQKGAVAAFEGLGFRPEGLMRNHVRDLSGDKHDLLVMGLDVVAFHGTLESYGVGEAAAAGGDQAPRGL